MNKKLIINKDFGQHKAGTEVRIKCTEDGTPLDVFWRRRLKDAVVDNCVEWKKMNETKIENKSNKRNKGENS